jgi:oxaloacetate decarboxylase gamma subunit
MDMLEQSGVLTLLGMGVVFSFLVILILGVTLAGKCIHALGADKDPERPARPVSGGGVRPDNAAVTAAISAAVNEYQKTR